MIEGILIVLSFLMGLLLGKILYSRKTFDKGSGLLVIPAGITHVSIRAQGGGGGGSGKDGEIEGEAGSIRFGFIKEK